MPRAGEVAGRCRLAAACGWRRAVGRVGADRHARDLPDPRDPGAAQRAGRFRVRDAGAGLGRDQPAGDAGAEGALSWKSCPGRSDRRLRALRAGRRLRRGGVAMQRADRRRACRPGWRENLDLQWRHRRLLRGLRTLRGGWGERTARAGPRLPRNLGLHRRRRDARPGDRRADPGDRPAPAGAASLHRLPGAVVAAYRRGRRRLQGGDAHARRLPHFGRRRGAGICAPCDGRGFGACHDATDVRPHAGGFPADPGQAGADGNDHRQLGAAGVPRRLAA